MVILHAWCFLVQLPPCSDMAYDASVLNERGHQGVKKVDRHYLFENPCWRDGLFKMVTLSTSWRHRDDPDMAEFLR